MSNRKTTRRALLTSVMALVMCVVMLVGTTFAWFTDTASTGVNKIQAGNLDIELAYKNAYMPTEVPATDDGFAAVTENTKVFNESALWEPGHVEYVVLKISNAGTLALKYKLGINIAGETGSTNVYGDQFNLSNYIKFAVLEGDKTIVSDGAEFKRETLMNDVTDTNSKLIKAGYTSEETSLYPKVTPAVVGQPSEKVVTLVVWMPTDVGNEANHMTGKPVPSIDLGIKAVATQLTHESDSFNDKYDEKATYPVMDNAGLSDAITDATDGDTVVIAPGEYDLPKSAGGKTEIPAGATIAGAGKDKTVLATDSKNHKITGDNVTIKDVTIDGTEHNAFDGSGAIKLTGDNAVLDNVNLIGGGQGTYGHTLGVDPKGDTVTTIRNTTISGAFRAIQSYSLNGTLLIENSTLAPQCYCLNVDAGTGKLVVNDSTLKGWTSYTSSVESATFTNCTFEVNPGSYGYNCVRAYTNTTFVNCDFGDEFWFGAADNAVTVTFENCRFKGVAIIESNVNDILDDTDNANTTVVVK